MEKETRQRLERLTQQARRLLEQEFREQLEGRYDILLDGRISLAPGAHLSPRERVLWDKLVAAIAHKRSQGITAAAAVAAYLREAAFHTLNRFVALKMLEARKLVQECISRGEDSAGFKEFIALAPGLVALPDKGYRLYVETIFDEIAQEVRALFDRRDAATLLWPRRQALLDLLAALNDPEVAAVWGEDETIGWVYQYFNGDDERKQMRAESQAPRNSRELAVRNQFFTPRYVVEFLTDNTLGRIWYEMARGQTHLADQCRYLVRRPTEIFLAEGETAPEKPDQEGLSQEELLKQPVHIPNRPLKDPREIRLLDPACGSMHFGLYAFDLFETIYEEAWDNGSCPALQEAYASKDEFLKDVPRLIIEHNIHGIDIDPRAVQIAGLSLWLRAQKAWQARGIKPAERPRVRRSNIVCAEPMPGSLEMLEEFLATLDPPLLGELVKTVFDKMQLAGEAGSLLKIEEEIRATIDTARKEWLKQQGDLFTRQDGSQEEFFETAEQQVIDALRTYAEQADADSYQRRLFADDAARGFAFIDLLRKHYDVLLMNPPFGEASKSIEETCADLYPEWNFNVFCCFGIRALDLSDFVGSITDRAYMLKTSYAEYREKVFVRSGRCAAVVDLGWGVLDANVEVNIQVFYPKSSQIRFANLMSEGEQKDSRLLEAAASRDPLRWQDREPGDFEGLADFMLSYELPKWQLSAIKSGVGVSASLAEAKSGLKAGRVEQFVRLLWEVPEGERGSRTLWNYFQNGGSYAPFYCPTFLVIRYDDDWKSIRAVPSSRITGLEDYWKSGVSYGKRTDFIYGFPMPDGQVFSNEGMAVFPLDFGQRWAVLAFINSSVIQDLMNLLCGQHKAHSYFNKIFLNQEGLDFNQAATSAKQLVTRLAEADQVSETSLYFGCPPGIDVVQANLGEAVRRWTQRMETTLESARAEYDDCSREICEILAEGEVARPVIAPNWAGLIFESDLTLRFPVLGIVSYLVGTAFGRWDIRYATGERQPPELPDPFDPLPVCPPGMLQNPEGLPAEPKDVPADYPLRISWPGILVDDENHPEDIVARLREAIEVIWPSPAGSGSRAEAIEQEACEILGVKTLRDYFRRPAAFFADHLKRYSKSRRRAPIYWPLSTKSGSYTLWLYYHRLNDQTLYTCVNDFVEPKLQQVTGNLESLRNQSDRTSKDEKDLSMFFDLQAEFEEYREDLLRIAKLWKPNLNDGVQVTAAPLWPLFQHKPWQKVLKDTWKKLEKGDYDWAHLAMNYWPDRVREKCKTDKSLAIAHGLEELYEEPPVQPKQKRGQGRTV